MGQQVFVSYSATDRDWAQLIVEETERRLPADFHLFFDRERLLAGDRWEEKLDHALEGSAHMVVLWSKHAKGSDWVNRERNTFHALLRRRATREEHGRPEAAGRLLIVLLDDEPHSFTSFQTINTIRDRQAYNAPAASCDRRTIGDVAGAIVAALRGERQRPLPVAVLTITRAELPHLDIDQRPAFPGAVPLRQLLANLGIASPEQLLEYYGDSRRSWKPFGEDTIEFILERVRQDLANEIGFEWEWIDDALCGEDERLYNLAARRLQTDQAVIVIDPLACAGEQRVRERLSQHLHMWLDNGRATIMVLSIRPTWERPRYLRQMVRQMNAMIVDRYDNPVIPSATCSVFTGDDADIKRLLRTMVRAQSDAKPPRPVYF